MRRVVDVIRLGSPRKGSRHSATVVSESDSEDAGEQVAMKAAKRAMGSVGKRMEKSTGAVKVGKAHAEVKKRKPTKAKTGQTQRLSKQG